MEVKEATETMTDAQSNRRQIPRFDVDEPAAMLVVSHGTRCQCRILDLSLGGCRLYTDDRVEVSVSTRVEVSFKVNGIVLRFPGTVQWTDGRHMVGVRFAEMSSRRRDELSEILNEVDEENTARAAKEAAAERAAAEQVTAERLEDDLLWERQGQRILEEKENQRRLSELEEIRLQAEREIQRKRAEQEEMRKKADREALLLAAQFRSAAATPLPVNPVPFSASNPASAKAAPRERRAQSRHEVDTAAVIQLININSKQTGRIIDLSLGGCRIRTDARFPVGIYTRAETEFYLEGLPFRLGGVVQAIHNGNLVGIRFLDMSERKKEQLEQLIEEIEAAGPAK
jgi:c-di-GMP-binding flagellar brake protein YcgR